MTFKEISPFKLQGNAAERIGLQWMLVAAAKPDGSVNAMTAAWGGLGFVWQEPVAFVFIRPQRCTKTFVEVASTFSLSFLASEYRDALAFMGGVSGFEDPQKVEHSGLTLAFQETPVTQANPPGSTPVEQTPYFAEAEVVLICERLYQQDMLKDNFLDQQIPERFYGRTSEAEGDDFHTLYLAKIVKTLVRE